MCFLSLSLFLLPTCIRHRMNDRKCSVQPPGVKYSKFRFYLAARSGPFDTTELQTTATHQFTFLVFVVASSYSRFLRHFVNVWQPRNLKILWDCYCPNVLVRIFSIIRLASGASVHGAVLLCAMKNYQESIPNEDERNTNPTICEILQFLHAENASLSRADCIYVWPKIEVQIMNDWSILTRRHMRTKTGLYITNDIWSDGWRISPKFHLSPSFLLFELTINIERRPILRFFIPASFYTNIHFRWKLFCKFNQCWSRNFYFQIF